MFEDFLGNESLKTEMTRLLETSSLPHAVALCGKQGCGGGYFARLLGEQYLKDRKGQVLKGIHPDFLEITGQGISGEISVDTVRDTLYEVSKAAVCASGRRVVYIRHADKLNTSSSNALLKAMEEPGEGVLFLLTVSSTDELLETIVSRLAVYNVLPLDVGLCAEETVKRIRSCDPDTSKKLSAVFSGRLGSVLRVLKDKKAGEIYRCAVSFCEAAAKEDRYTAMVASASCIESREQYRDFLQMCSAYCGYLLARNPFNSKKLERISSAVGEAYSGANGVNLKLSAARLSIKASGK